MSDHQIVQYNGPVIDSSSSATPNTLMERDNQGNSQAATFTATVALATDGALFLEGKTTTVNGTMDETATVWQMDCTSGAQTQTLPPASTVPNQVYWVMKKDSSANTGTIKGNGTENINGANTFVLTAQYKYAKVWSNGTQWYILGSN